MILFHTDIYIFVGEKIADVRGLYGFEQMVMTSDGSKVLLQYDSKRWKTKLEFEKTVL